MVYGSSCVWKRNGLVLEEDKFKDRDQDLPFECKVVVRCYRILDSEECNVVWYCYRILDSETVTSMCSLDLNILWIGKRIDFLGVKSQPGRHK